MSALLPSIPRIGEAWMQDRAVELRAIIIVSARHVDSWVRTHGPMLRSVAWSLLLGAVGAGFVLAGALWRAWSLRPDRRLERGTTVAARTQPASLALFLGSGGHTAELLQMAAALPSERYSPRTYIVSGGDELSARKAHQAEKARAGMQTEAQTPKNKDGRKVSAYRVLTLPRARNVGQSWLTTPITTLRSLVSASWLVFAGPKLDVVLMNGPGTCVPLVAATYLLRVLGRPSPRLVYVESFARVETLSMTGKLVRPLVDRFVVQWVQMSMRLADGPGGAADVECLGCLV